MKSLYSLLLLPALIRSGLSYTALSDKSLKSLPSPGDDFDINNGKILAPILQPRVPGTEGSRKVLRHFADWFSQNLPDWKLAFQNSTSVTPVSNGAEVPFVNLIATRDPPWVEREGQVGRLALVAHYDSLMHPEGFVGATDSAAPCAMIMHAARTIDDALTRKWQKMKEEGVGDFADLEDHRGVQVILLDGEEAFKAWSATDSLYGARSLAEEWEQTTHPAMSVYPSPLASIDLFVLLDLLGAENPLVPSYFRLTHWAYRHIADVEKRLRNVGKLKSSPKAPFLPDSEKADSSRWLGGFIGDDHEPFLARGVDILHLITSPFPSVWHLMEDDGEHLDPATVEDWALITAAFAAEWMELEGFMDEETKTGGAVKPRADQHGEIKKSELFGYE